MFRNLRKLCIFVGVLNVFSPICFAQSACTDATCLTVSKNGWIVGEIKTFAFGGNNNDTIIKNLHSQGWLECEGQTLDITEFANLRKAIGMTWGSKDPLNSFLVPDLRAMFLRGWNHNNSQTSQPQYPDQDVGTRGAPRPELAGTGSPGNTGDAVGSMQQSAFQSHSHVLATYTGGSLKSQQGSWTGALLNLGNNTSLIQPAGGSLYETRPSNAYVMYFIYVGQDVTGLDPTTGKITHNQSANAQPEKRTTKQSH
jgi:microcystin-dependent protein